MFTSTHQTVSAKTTHFPLVDVTSNRQPNAMNAVPFDARGAAPAIRMSLSEARRRRQTRRANR